MVFQHKRIYISEFEDNDVWDLKNATISSSIRQATNDTPFAVPEVTVSFTIKVRGISTQQSPANQTAALNK